MYLLPPPRQEIRILAIWIEALEKNKKDPAYHIIAIRSWGTITYLVKKTPFSKKEIQITKNNAERFLFDLVYYPGIKAEEVNIFNKFDTPLYYNISLQLLSPSKRKNFYKKYLFQVKPVSDNQPFFSNFFKINKIKTTYKALGQKWLPFLNGEFLVPFLLIQSIVIAFILIFLPFFIFQKSKIMQAGDKESATCWKEFFKDLKRRGLDGRNVQLGIMDGLPGLERIFTEEFLKAKIQRCQVHVARNVLAKVPMKLKQAVAEDVRTIFYASSKKKAMGYFDLFQEKWKKEVPSAVKCLERSIENCLTFFHFPREDWISLRTSNIIERLNKEFKRRTKPMEIVAGERACYTLLAFICLKMELHWRNFPMGKRASYLPVLQNLELPNFTQSS